MWGGVDGERSLVSIRTYKDEEKEVGKSVLENAPAT